MLWLFVFKPVALVEAVVLAVGAETTGLEPLNWNDSIEMVDLSLDTTRHNKWPANFGIISSNLL